MEWTEERIERVRKMWAEGVSASRIATALDCGATKNMVIGKIHRLKLSRSVKPRVVKVVALRQPRKARPSAPKVSVGLILLPAAEPAKPRHSGYGCSIVEVTGCRWPVEDSPTLHGGFGFCNGPQCDGSSYCAEHRLESVAHYSRELIRKTISSTILTLKKARAA